MPRRLNNLHPTLHRRPCVALIIRGRNSREEGDVHAKGFRGEFPSLLDGGAECIGGGLGERGEDAEATAVRDCGDELGDADPVGGKEEYVSGWEVGRGGCACVYHCMPPWTTGLLGGVLVSICIDLRAIERSGANISIPNSLVSSVCNILLVLVVENLRAAVGIEGRCC